MNLIDQLIDSYGGEADFFAEFSAQRDDYLEKYELHQALKFFFSGKKYNYSVKKYPIDQLVELIDFFKSELIIILADTMNDYYYINFHKIDPETKIEIIEYYYFLTRIYQYSSLEKFREDYFNKGYGSFKCKSLILEDYLDRHKNLYQFSQDLRRVVQKAKKKQIQESRKNKFLKFFSLTELFRTIRYYLYRKIMNESTH